MPHHECPCGVPAVWRIARYGDATLRWTCDTHLATTCHDLQRGWENTNLTVTKHHQPKDRHD